MDSNSKSTKEGLMKFSNIPVLDQDGVYMGVVIITIITEINTYDLCTSLNITL